MCPDLSLVSALLPNLSKGFTRPKVKGCITWLGGLLLGRVLFPILELIVGTKKVLTYGEMGRGSGTPVALLPPSLMVWVI